MIDTHCHLTFPDFSDDRPAGGVAKVLARAAREGVTGCISVSTTVPDALNAQQIARAFPRVWFTAGVHPLYADKGPHDWPLLGAIASDPRCVAWGEMGLDNHYADPPRVLQDQVLEAHLALIESCDARGLIKPVVIHCREAYAELIDRLRVSTIDPSRFVFHCFTGDESDMRRLLDFGACVSFTGVLTYRNAPQVRAAALLVPDDRFMVETDAPFLSPEPHRGERPCQPWMAAATARRLAEIRGVSFEALVAQVNTTTRRFFGIEP